MSTFVRISLNRINQGLNGALNKSQNVTLRTITSKAVRNQEERPPKPAPWPYQHKGFNLLNYFFDKTTSRLDENSKIIVVEGLPAIGKSNFAKKIAEEFEMLYLPEANLDMNYINSYGFDLRKLDAQLPDSCKSWDVMDFLRNPNHRHTTRFQIQQYIVKLSQYVDALAHVLSTGQGVVLDRCVYSDFVFLEAMYSQSYISNIGRKKYYEFRDCTIGELLRPHLVIYLDVPVPKVLENIKKRAISYEVNSPVLTTKYLEVIENQYKQNYLREIGKHAELLIYDWGDEGDVEIVVEDVERIDFNKYDSHDKHQKDWVYGLEEEWACLRHKYADKKDSIMSYCHIPCFEVPEMVIEATEADIYHRTVAEAPGEKYVKGYNSDVGDRGILFKTKMPHRDTLPLIERRKM